MTGHGAKFGRKKEAAIVALLTQRTTEDTARTVGIGGATLLARVTALERAAQSTKDGRRFGRRD